MALIFAKSENLVFLAVQQRKVSGLAFVTQIFSGFFFLQSSSTFVSSLFAQKYFPLGLSDDRFDSVYALLHTQSESVIRSMEEGI